MKDLRQAIKLFLILAFLNIYNTSFAVLSTPTINSPVNNATKVLNKINVTTISSGGTYFVFDLDSVSTFNSAYHKKFAKSTTSTRILDSLPFNNVHYVRVKIFNSAGTDSSAWSATIKFTTYNTIPVLNKTQSLAVLGFSWTASTVSKLEIQVDTVKSFNSSRFLSYISPSSTTFNGVIKYTKCWQSYFVRYRSRYGSRFSAWSDGGTVISGQGYFIIDLYLTDSFLFKKNIKLNTNYNADPNVIYSIRIDTTLSFNSPKLFTKTTTADNFDFNAETGFKYFLNIKMSFPGGTYDTIYRFNMAKNSPPYTILANKSFQFSIPPGYTSGTIEMDTTLKFNSPKKIHFDTSFILSTSQQSFIKSYVSIKLYHNMYLRYKTTGPGLNPEWFSTNKRFLIPGYSVNPGVNPPITNFTSNTYFPDMSGFVYEADTSNKFNSKIKIRNYVSKSKTDSIRSLKFGLKYFIRLKQFDATKDTTEWGVTQLLQTLDTVNINNPKSGIVYYPALSFSYNTAAGIKMCNWQLDTNSNFSTAINLFFKTNLTYPNLKVKKHYYWRMRLISAVDTSKWSRTGWFDYDIQNTLPFPFLIYPPDKSINISPVNINFLWKDNSGGLGLSYEFVLKEGTNSNMASIVTPSILIDNLKPNTTYTWYVRSFGKPHTPLGETEATKFTFKTSSGSSSLENISNDQLLIYPNPASTLLFVEQKTGEPFNSIEIFNSMGQLILNQFSLNETNLSIDISSIKSGLYFISCKSPKGISVSKFIKN